MLTRYRTTRRKKREAIFGIRSTPPKALANAAGIRAAVQQINDQARQRGATRRAISKDAESVLVSVLHFMNLASGLCCPSYDTIARQADCNRRTVGRALKVLEAHGLITWIHRLKRTATERDCHGNPILTISKQKSSNLYALGPTLIAFIASRDQKVWQNVPGIGRMPKSDSLVFNSREGRPPRKPVHAVQSGSPPSHRPLEDHQSFSSPQEPIGRGQQGLMGVHGHALWKFNQHFEIKEDMSKNFPPGSVEARTLKFYEKWRSESKRRPISQPG